MRDFFFGIFAACFIICALLAILTYIKMGTPAGCRPAYAAASI